MPVRAIVLRIARELPALVLLPTAGHRARHDVTESATDGAGCVHAMHLDGSRVEAAAAETEPVPELACAPAA